MLHTDQSLDITNNLLVLGDINENILSGKKLNVTDIMDKKNLKNVITEPTRVARTSSTLIDPILVSDDLPVFSSGVVDFAKSNSDHKDIVVTINTSLAYTRNICCYDIGDCNRLKSLIASTDG